MKRASLLFWVVMMVAFISADPTWAGDPQPKKPSEMSALKLAALELLEKIESVFTKKAEAKLLKVDRDGTSGKVFLDTRTRQRKVELLEEQPPTSGEDFLPTKSVDGAR